MDGNEACAGRKQSPINIVSSLTNFVSSMGNLVYTGYDQNPSSMRLKNNGHTGGSIYTVNLVRIYIKSSTTFTSIFFYTVAYHKCFSSCKSEVRGSA